MTALAPLATFALPVGPAARSDLLHQATQCVAQQSMGEFEAILALNGCSEEVGETAADICRADARFRAITLPQPSLPAALNAILAEAQCELIARMDADDLCSPDRLAKQAAALNADPSLAGVGCAFDIIDVHGEHLRTIRPPVDPRRVDWRLLLGNVFAHGSMTLRASALRRAGGYEETLARGQDYDLWLRMTAQGMALVAIPESLYQRRVDSAAAMERADAAQAQAAASRLLAAWSTLDQGEPARDAAEVELLARVLACPGDDAARDAIEAALDERGATLARLLALLFAQSQAGARVPPSVWTACWRARLREVGRAMRDEGVERVWLWGAGEHTRRLLEHRGELGVGVAGVVDDALVDARRFGFTIAPPDAIEPGEHALISSDAYEARMAASDAARRLRTRGVRIWRLYADQEAPS